MVEKQISVKVKLDSKQHKFANNKQKNTKKKFSSNNKKLSDSMIRYFEKEL